MRLIDADELIKDLTKWFPQFTLEGIETKTLFNQILHDIDNAPTLPQVAVFAENASKEEIEDFKQELENVLERPQGEFTDLERKVIADSINYLLGAELLEENGYTEEVINALKSVLQKIGAEETHL